MMLVVYLGLASLLLGRLEGAAVEEEALERDQRDVLTSTQDRTGVVYTRWGKSSCPTVKGTRLIYAGRTGGTKHNVEGGASNYICLPDNPQYLKYSSGVQGRATIHATKFGGNDQPLASFHQHDVACAMCYVSSRSAQLMIPARHECPTGWTREYYGYLMSEGTKWSGRHSTMFECVDSHPDVLHEESVQWPAVMSHVEAVCDGIKCPPYSAEKELTCVVCTK